MTSEDRARGFPAFGPVKRRRGGFARSWWGGEWIRAMEDVALSSASLAKGRRFAHNAHVGSITASPGLLSATVFDDAGIQHHTRVHVAELSEPQWERFLDRVASTAGHIAALLDRDMPPDLVADANDAGVPLLPDFGDLEQECSCGDWGHPCRHAAALGYQAAWLLDEDPFLLLLLRGRGERELTAALRDRNAAARSSEVVAPEGVDAEQAFAAPVAALPPEPSIPDAEPVPPEYPAAPGVEPAMLALLVTDASSRARELLRAPVPTYGERLDAVRLAATHAELRTRTATDPAFRRDVEAWQFGGAAFVEVLGDPWDPPPAELARARRALATAWEDEEPPVFEAWRNRWTDREGGVQVRYGRDGRWYPLRYKEKEWWPAGPPAHGVTGALG